MKKYLSIAAALIVMVGVVATTGTAGTPHEEPCEPQDAWTETTGWVLESPGAGWYQVDETDRRRRGGLDRGRGESNGSDSWHVYAGNLEDEPPPVPTDRLAAERAG